MRKVVPVFSNCVELMSCSCLLSAKKVPCRCLAYEDVEYLSNAKVGCQISSLTLTYHSS